MLTRRCLLGTGFAAVISSAHGSKYQAGDLVKVVCIPPQFPTASRDLTEHWRRCRLCLGKICRVVYVDEAGRPELNVTEHVVPFVPGLIGCSISFEPDCLALVNCG